MTVEAAEDRRAPPRAGFLLTSAQGIKAETTHHSRNEPQSVRHQGLPEAGAESRPLTSGDVDWE